MGEAGGSLRETTETMAGLLRQIGENQGKEMGGQNNGAYVGDGLPPVPQKTVDRIQKGEYVEMGDLLPEFWVAPREGEDKTAQGMARSRGRRRTQDICVWSQCFAIYVAVMSAKWPQRVPEMMAYMIQIIRASQEYEGLWWFVYDEAYRRQAAATGHVEWSKINPSIFTVCFTSKARRGQRCELCLSSSHGSGECILAGGDEDLRSQLMALESARGTATQITAGRMVPSGYEWTDICKLFNEGRCSYKICRFRHACITCGGEHPAIANPSCAGGGRRNYNPLPGPVRGSHPGRGLRRGRPY